MREERTKGSDHATSEQSAREWESSGEYDIWSALARVSSDNVRRRYEKSRVVDCRSNAADGDAPAWTVAIVDVFRNEQCIAATASGTVMTHVIYSFIVVRSIDQISIRNMRSTSASVPVFLALPPPSIFWKHPLCLTMVTTAVSY